MECSSPENMSIDRRKVIKELVRGREFATQLQILLNNPDGDSHDESVSADDLLEKIMESFSEALSVLNSGELSEVGQNLVTSGVSSPSFDDRRSEDSGESRKSPALKDRRGGYKRRKLLHSWTNLTPTPIEDGHAWRKYGQKDILNAKYPRSYFRCTHKNDQGCTATKQVQRTEDDPPMYKTIYMGQHTCQDLLKAPHLILDSTLPKDSFLFSFGSHVLNKTEHLSSFPSIKQEFKEERLSDLTHNNNSSSEYLLSPEFTSAFDQIESTGPTSDAGEVISGVYSPCMTSNSLSFDMDMMVGSVDLDDSFHYEDFLYSS